MKVICRKCASVFEKFKTKERKSKKEFWHVDINGKKLNGNLCHQCGLINQQLRRKKESNLTTRKYEKTPRGFLMRLYRNMKSRVLGIQKEKAHLYLGKELIEKGKFYAWALKDEQFLSLFEAYRQSNYSRRMAPTVDRINSLQGYVETNMRWLTHSENSRLGALSKWNKPRAV